MELNRLLDGARFAAPADIDGAPHDEAWVSDGANDVRHLLTVR
jgi:hypothetical protein